MASAIAGFKSWLLLCCHLKNEVFEVETVDDLREWIYVLVRKVNVFKKKAGRLVLGWKKSIRRVQMRIEARRDICWCSGTK